MSPPWWPDPGDLTLPQVQAEMEAAQCRPWEVGPALDVFPRQTRPGLQVSSLLSMSWCLPAEPCREAGRTECALCPRAPGLQSL